MRIYKSISVWLKHKDATLEYDNLNHQLHGYSQRFKNKELEEQFKEQQKSGIISLFRICTVIQIIVNISLCLTRMELYRQETTAILRGSMAIWLMLTLILEWSRYFRWIDKINFFLVFDSYAHVAIYAIFYTSVQGQLTVSQIALSPLLDGFTQAIFAVSFFMICPNWICQIMIVLGYFIPLLKISKLYEDYRCWYLYLLVFFVCLVLRLNDKHNKLMFLQIHRQKQNTLACKDILDQCVPSSIIIVKKIIKIDHQVQELIENNNNSTHLEILYNNNPAAKTSSVLKGFDSLKQLQKISVIQNDQTGQHLIHVLEKFSFTALPQNDTQHIKYALGRDQLILNCQSKFLDQTQNDENKKAKQYCDVTLNSCIWEGENSIIIVINDTTDRVTIIEKLKDLDTYKDNLLATVGHDLKTPLNSTQLLLFNIEDMCKTKTIFNDSDIKSIDFKLSIDLRQQINDIYLSNCMLMNMINDLLDFSQIRKGALRLQIDSFQLNECLDFVFKIFNHQIESKKLKLVIERGINGSIRLQTDQNRLNQILINLLSNSLKFTQEGQIKLSINQHETYLDFSVEDTGIGMHQDIVAKLFQLYATFNLGNQNKQGVGLGLVISSKLVGLLGPQEIIQVESKEGIGSKFTFRIHRELQMQVKSCVFDEDHYEAQRPRKTKAISHKLICSALRIPLHQYKVLIVDDTIFNIQAFKVILQKTVYCAVTDAYNGLDAVKTVQSGLHFDLIFMDINMPIMDGYQATKLIRKYEREQKLKPSIIIIASAGTLQQEFRSIQESGANGMIEKPVIVKKLTELLKIHSFID